MKSIISFAVIALLGTSSAIKIAGRNEITVLQRSNGIFSSMIKEAEEEQKIDDEITDARARKKKQLEEAEKEHDQAVKEEEEEQAREEEKAAKEFEEREVEQRHVLAEKRKMKMLDDIDKGVYNVQIGSRL